MCLSRGNLVIKEIVINWEMLLTSVHGVCCNTFTAGHHHHHHHHQNFRLQYASIVSAVWPIITWLSYSRSLTELKVLIRWFHRELLCVKWDVKIDFLITVADQLLLL